MTQEIGSFAALGIHPSVLAAVTAVGYEEPSAIQSQAIPVILGGHDMIGQAQTWYRQDRSLRAAHPVQDRPHA